MLRLASLWFVLLFCACSQGAETFTVATYNLENYRLVASRNRQPKSEESKAKVLEYLLSFRPDVLALQEIGSPESLVELQASLKEAGLDYPHSEYLNGPDPYIDLALLSRFPIIERRPHKDESFLLHGKRHRVSRGFLEVVIKVNDDYAFTLLTAHLKSRLQSSQADESELRQEEALLLREKINAIQKRDPEANIVALGDFNDVRNSRPVRTLIGRGRAGLFDLRPAERNGDERSTGRRALDDRAVTWTHHFLREDTYSRVDYILVSQPMAKEWLPSGTYIPTLPNWGVASDHRPIVASFKAEDQE